MRKVAAIFFLSVLCFSAVGYRYVFDYLERKQDAKLEAQLDEQQYDESSLVSLKTSFPIQYSYLNNKPEEFERWNGEIIIKGVKYKYVKRRFYNDSLELLCIPNDLANKLNAAKHDYFGATNDLQANQGKGQEQGKIPVFKNLLSEYCEAVPDWGIDAVTLTRSHQSSYLLLVPQYTPDDPGQPPKFS